MENSTNNEYEIISHNKANFKIFLVDLLYRTPHAHKDFEIGLIVRGNISLNTLNGSYQLRSGDVFILNPYHIHELKADTPALVLSLQIPYDFFETYFPNISHVEFLSEVITKDNEIQKSMTRLLHDLAKEYFRKESLFEFRCDILINRLFCYMLQSVKYTIHTEQESKAQKIKGKRIRRIMHYIDAHYTEKLLLSDIARQEELDLYYLSHFFKESFGVSFQTYVNKLRCEHARNLLLVTDKTLLDICIESGFSDPKYFNKSFKEQYGCLPRQYRTNFQNLELHDQQNNLLSTQQFLSEEASIVILEL